MDTSSETQWRRNMWTFALLGPVIPIPFLASVIDGYLDADVILGGIGFAFLVGLVPAICAGYVFNRLQFPLIHLIPMRRLFIGAVVGYVSGFLGTVAYAVLLSIWGGFPSVVFLMVVGTFAGAVCGIVVEAHRCWVERAQ